MRNNHLVNATQISGGNHLRKSVILVLKYLYPIYILSLRHRICKQITLIYLCMYTLNLDKLAPCQWGSHPYSHAYKLIVILQYDNHQETPYPVQSTAFCNRSKDGWSLILIRRNFGKTWFYKNGCISLNYGQIFKIKNLACSALRCRSS